MTRRESDLAWAAGLFEGEGYAGSRQVGPHGNTAPMLSLAMTDEETVRRFHAIMGFGAVTEQPSKRGHKTMWWWKAGAKNECLGIAALRPWLSGRRQAQIDTALDACAYVGASETVRRGWAARRENAHL